VPDKAWDVVTKGVTSTSRTEINGRSHFGGKITFRGEALTFFRGSGQKNQGGPGKTQTPDEERFKKGG